MQNNGNRTTTNTIENKDEQHYCKHPLFVLKSFISKQSAVIIITLITK